MLENQDFKKENFHCHVSQESGAKKSFVKAKKDSGFLKHFTRYFIIHPTTYESLTEVFDALDKLEDLYFGRVSSVGCFILSEDRYLFFTTDARLKDRITFNKNRGVDL